MYVSYRGHFLNTKIEGKDLHAHMLQHISMYVKNCFCKKVLYVMVCNGQKNKNQNVAQLIYQILELK